MFSFAKFGPMEYVVHYANGKVRREGPGLSFFYWVPTSSIVAVPLGSSDLSFVFNQVTEDFQTITIQGQLTYRVTAPRKLAELLDFAVNAAGSYTSKDPEKVGQRLINESEVATGALVQSMTLKEALRAGPAIGNSIMKALQTSPAVQALGVEPLTVSIISVAATPEMARALEATAREALQQESDLAIYARRNHAVAEERKIKESELSTEIAVEEKKRQIRETQIQTEIAVEERRAALVDLQSENDRKAADTRSYAMQANLRPLKEMDWRTLLALAGGGADPRVAIAHGFLELAENAQKIGTLNISPDLLNTLLSDQTR
ncbi:MAG TPA: SPFH domain-containing protein [Thermoanaerobaculia bacterium]|nr:SPFH domain-containing protein [Thermoanaerobaculia bacterium]